MGDPVAAMPHFSQSSVGDSSLQEKVGRLITETQIDPHGFSVHVPLARPLPSLTPAQSQSFDGRHSPPIPTRPARVLSGSSLDLAVLNSTVSPSPAQVPSVS